MRFVQEGRIFHGGAGGYREKKAQKDLAEHVEIINATGPFGSEQSLP